MLKKSVLSNNKVTQQQQTSPILILEATDFSQNLFGHSEARAIKAILNNLFLIKTSDVIEMKDGFALFQVGQNLKGYSAIYLSAHSNKKGFQVASGFVTTWKMCGEWLQNYPYIQILFLSGCEAGSYDTVKSIAQHCNTVKYVFGPTDKITFAQAAMAAHVLFFQLLVKKNSPELAASHASIAADIQYSYWNCDNLRV